MDRNGYKPLFIVSAESLSPIIPITSKMKGVSLGECAHLQCRLVVKKHPSVDSE